MAAVPLERARESTNVRRTMQRGVTAVIARSPSSSSAYARLQIARCQQRRPACAARRPWGHGVQRRARAVASRRRASSPLGESSRVEPSRTESSRARTSKRERASWFCIQSLHRRLRRRRRPVCASLVGASPSAIVPDMEAYQNGRDRADVFVPI